MSKASRITVLCEDHLQKVVVWRFLTKGWAVNPRNINVVPYPHGKGSGEGHVRTRYLKELNAFRTRSASAKTILIVVIDADTGSIEQHHRELEIACQRADPAIEPRKTNEAVVHLIPKRHIETWLAYLDDKKPNEDESYKLGYEFKHKESRCHNLVDKLVHNCKHSTPLNSPPPSLKKSCDEFERIRSILQG